jgi:hypothetical protein
MTTHADFEGFLRLLEEHRVDSMIVGGDAVAYHGFPWFTNALEKPDTVLSIGLEPVRIDLLSTIAGLSFDDARRNRVRGRYGATDVWFIGKADLLRNKRATGRQRDLGDVEELS